MSRPNIYTKENIELLHIFETEFKQLQTNLTFCSIAFKACIKKCLDSTFSKKFFHNLQRVELHITQMDRLFKHTNWSFQSRSNEIHSLNDSPPKMLSLPKPYFKRKKLFSESNSCGPMPDGLVEISKSSNILEVKRQGNKMKKLRILDKSLKSLSNENVKIELCESSNCQPKDRGETENLLHTSEIHQVKNNSFNFLFGCLHCTHRFKTSYELEQHLLRHFYNNPVEASTERKALELITRNTRFNSKLVKENKKSRAVALKRTRRPLENACKQTLQAGQSLYNKFNKYSTLFCRVCSEQFEDVTRFKMDFFNHLLGNNPDVLIESLLMNSTYICPLCDFDVEDKEEIITHAFNHMEEVVLDCQSEIDANEKTMSHSQMRQKEGQESTKYDALCSDIDSVKNILNTDDLQIQVSNKCKDNIVDDQQHKLKNITVEKEVIKPMGAELKMSQNNGKVASEQCCAEMYNLMDGTEMTKSYIHKDEAKHSNVMKTENLKQKLAVNSKKVNKRCFPKTKPKMQVTEKIVQNSEIQKADVDKQENRNENSDTKSDFSIIPIINKEHESALPAEDTTSCRRSRRMVSRKFYNQYIIDYF